jgi:hypothetical protein
MQRGIITDAEAAGSRSVKQSASREGRVAVSRNVGAFAGLIIAGNSANTLELPGAELTHGHNNAATNGDLVAIAPGYRIASREPYARRLPVGKQLASIGLAIP